MKILIGVPSAGHVPIEFINSIDMLRSTKHQIARLFIARSIIHVARERMIDTAILQGYDAVLFIDDDMTFSPDLVDRLASHNVPVASAMCFKRIPPYEPCFYSEVRAKGGLIEAHPYEFDVVPEKPFKVVAAGAACMLIRLDAIKKIPKPWFLPLPYSGEDLAFCYKLMQADIPVLIDPQPRVGHLETRPIYVDQYLEARHAHDR